MSDAIGIYIACGLVAGLGLAGMFIEAGLTKIAQAMRRDVNVKWDPKARAVAERFVSAHAPDPDQEESP